MSAPVCSPRVSAGIRPDPGAEARLPAWWGATDWVEVDVRGALRERPELCKEHHVSPDTVLAVARGMAHYADHRTGRDCRPTNARLLELVRVSLSTLKRARRVLEALELVRRLIQGRSIMTRSERLEAWRRGSSHRKVAAVFALCSRPRRAPRRATTELKGGTHSHGADLRSVDGGPPPGAMGVSTSREFRSGSPRRRTETRIGAPRRAHTEKGRRSAGGGDPGASRLAERVRGRLGWLRGTSARRITPTLARFARAGWGPRDVDLAVRDALAARGWRVPSVLEQPAAYLAALLRGVDPEDRPGALEEHMAEMARREDAYALQLATGAPCPHGRPAGDVPSPLRGVLACPQCRAAAAAS